MGSALSSQTLSVPFNRQFTSINEFTTYMINKILENKINLVLTIVLPLFSALIQIFSFTSIAAHDPDYYKNLKLDAYDQPGEMFLMNVNYLTVDSLAEIGNIFARFMFAVIGMIDVSQYIFTPTSGTALIQEQILMGAIFGFCAFSMVLSTINLVYTVFNMNTYSFGTEEWYYIKYYMFSDYAGDGEGKIGSAKQGDDKQQVTMWFGLINWFLQIFLDPKKVTIVFDIIYAIIFTYLNFAYVSTFFLTALVFAVPMELITFNLQPSLDMPHVPWEIFILQLAGYPVETPKMLTIAEMQAKRDAEAFKPESSPVKKEIVVNPIDIKPAPSPSPSPTPTPTPTPTPNGR